MGPESNYRAGLPRQQARPPQRPASWPDYAPDPPKKKRRNGRPEQRSPWPALLVIMLVLGVGFGGAGYAGLRWMQNQAATPINEGAGTGSKVDSAAVGAKPRVVELNKAARDGDFAFKVTRVRTGAGVTYVHVVLKNVGTAAQPLTSSVQQVSGTGGRRYQANSAAPLAASRRLWVEVAPGKVLSGIMVFPAGAAAKPFAVELHGTTGSPGLVVQF